MAVMVEQEEVLWLALRMTPQLGARRAVELVRRYGSPGAIFLKDAQELMAAGLSASVARSIEAGSAMDDALEQQRLLRATETEIVTLMDERYPDGLGQIFDPPLLLFTRGNAELMQNPAVAVVGTRRPSAYGTAVAEKFARDLAEAGLVVVSGMARGIDTVAHKAALAVGGKTVAVLGCGADVVYPAENRQLAAQIARDGLILSEYPLRTPGYPQNFPVRNRIVSGLSQGVLIVEGAQYSGSSITARLAMDQGREVFAVPGNVTSKQSWGPNLLIRQGARLVQEPSDVLSDLPEETRRRLKMQGRQRLLLDEIPHPMHQLRERVMRLLSPDEPLTIDDLIPRLNASEVVSPSELIAILFELELDGVVRQLPGKAYVKVWQ
ncbi:MAG: DNA-processing protein DprA [Bryobacter sp.]|jgi:DNA processing protein|nr:DNA-processing protein DprA [Bryobacter sp. CoA8 C33]